MVAVITAAHSAYSTSATAEPDCKAKVGQMLMVSIPPPPSKLVGGVTLFNPNLKQVQSPADVLEITKRLQQGRNPPLLIAVDQEGGLVARLNAKRGFTPIPKPADVGATKNTNAAFNFGKITAEELGAVGVNVNFGTVVDVNSNPNNPVIGKLGRSYSADPAEVAQMACSNIEGYAGSGVIPVIKHFPGHGDTKTDSHLDFAVVDKTKEEMEATELVPYKDILQRCPAGRDIAIMTGHLMLPKALNKEDGALPSSLSKKVVTGWLRDELNFKGVIFSDGLSMAGVKKFFPDKKELAIHTILAGNDVLTFVDNEPVFNSTEEEDQLINGICDAARADKNLMNRINESSQRIQTMKSSKGLVMADKIPDAPSGEDFARHRDILKRLGFEPLPPSAPGGTQPSTSLSPVTR